ncbi:MAG: T9SS type A sorting domain-containing protein [Elusimicrobiota bacterium]
MVIKKIFIPIVLLVFSFAVHKNVNAEDIGLTRAAEWSAGSIAEIHTINGFSYVGVSDKLVKVDALTLVPVSTITFTAVGSIAFDPDGYLYVGTRNQAHKVRLSDFSLESSVALTGPLSASDIFSTMLDGQGYGYFLSFGGFLSKVQLSNMTVVATSSVTSSASFYHAVLDRSRNFIYCPVYTSGVSPRAVFRVRTDTLATQDSLTISNPGYSAAGISFLDSAKNNLYVTNYSSSSGVVQINLDSFNSSQYLAFVSSPTTAGQYTWTAAVDSSNGIGYFGTYQTHPVIYKVNLANFTEIGSFSLNNGDGALWGYGFDSRTKTLYMSGTKTLRITTDGLNSSSVVKQYPYPNPFRPKLGHTSLTLPDLTANGIVKIFTVQGELIRQLETNSSGFATWDVKDDEGSSVSSGIYFIVNDNNVKYKVAVQK